MKRETTERQLLNSIMDYWEECISKNGACDFAVNDLLENFVKSCNAPYYGNDLYTTVLNLTNSQKRRLYKAMQNSGIKES